MPFVILMISKSGSVHWISSSLKGFCLSALPPDSGLYYQNNIKITFAFTGRQSTSLLGLGATPLIFCLVREWLDLNLSPLHVNTQAAVIPAACAHF